jgi:hypothetical protein
MAAIHGSFRYLKTAFASGDYWMNSTPLHKLIQQLIDVHKSCFEPPVVGIQNTSMYVCLSLVVTSL